MSKKILVVDDSATVRDVLTHHLQGGDYMVSTAFSGEQALEILKTEHFGVIIADLEMPGLDGFALIRAISELDFEPAIVLLSQHNARALQSAKDLAIAYSVNVLGTVTKPIDRDALFATLNEVADTRSGVWASTETVLAESEFMRGLMTDGLSPVFQPKLDLKNGNLVGAEVFARWSPPSGGFLGAGAVIKVAREKGHMDVLAYRMLELAMQQQGKWRKQGQEVTLSINISSENLRKPDFADVVSGLADQFEIDPSMVRLEVTESDLDVDTRVPFDVLSQLHMRGFGLALDDFGTGFAWLLRLKHMPFQEFVIDRQFVAGMEGSDTARIILETAIELSHKLNLKCTCEGIETEEQCRAVKELGADFGQGYLFGKPMVAEEFLIWMEDYKDGVLKIPGFDQ